MHILFRWYPSVTLNILQDRRRHLW